MIIYILTPNLLFCIIIVYYKFSVLTALDVRSVYKINMRRIVKTEYKIGRGG